MILAIDPGLSKSPGGTGYALFNDISSKLSPEKTGVLTSSLPEWKDRGTEITKKLIVETEQWDRDKGYSKYNITNRFYRELKVYIELPTFFQSLKGQMCATGKDGGDSDLVKLAFLVGSLHHAFSNLGCESVNLVRVNDWKGTMTKSAVESRIKRRLETPKLFFTSHAVDAVGIGLFVQGRFSANSENEKV